MSDLLSRGWLGPGAFFNASMVSAKALFTSENPSFFKVASSGFALPSRELGWGWNVTHLFRSLTDLCTCCLYTAELRHSILATSW